MALQAHALYDFEANEEHGELSLNAGDTVTVHRQDIGEGWWEGEVNGRRGLFPASYVQLDGGADTPDDHFDDDDGSDWDDSGDDDWDDEPTHQGHGAGTMEMTPIGHGHEGGDHQPTYGGPASSYGRAGTLKKSVYRFSVFVKAGAEAFLIGATKDVTIDANNMLHIQQTSDGPSWIPNPAPYHEIDVLHDGSRSKYKGIKTYEAYNILNAAPGVQVERRFKHFAWLHDRLVEKYSCICVPPLPGKEYSQKFGESLVDKRQQRLKMWLNRICRHPVLSRDDLALKHFLTCPTSDKTAWKNGKRKAEKDQFVNSMFFKLISQDNEEAKPGEKDAVRSRCDVIHTLALCEMSHFHQQRRSDFRDMMKAYFAAQIEFHQKIMDQLAAAKAEFDKLDF
ncbi:hypothetical protein PTSG_08745 [Salpingoeca rosetta]|uniref:Sorting nexin n=1 Tax=Salpingoeca rosetta (strain ATCC 50818 / BSB-021) TaxID=946362 RepID=F2UKK3_SALR5|nr:uncharacterized protein PTSG_08745 [Salpingoeca rosetta]EGD77652.1 hypothetical protein PTSG_08745 [Salpingoeca rosetta]|eukprot:XP_004990128.1 hypothetical protein PTSG_08745 [Salpingoeca rosetta]